MTHRINEGRTSPRTSLFAAAILESGHTRFPVRIRNISSSGALLQGDTLPRAGTIVRMVRGSLAASGAIRWCRDGRAGLSFTDAIQVEDWLRSCASKAHQQGVDAIVTAVKSGAQFAMPDSGKPPFQKNAPPSGLLDVQKIVAAVAERLAADPAMLERHAGEIQQLDFAASIIASLMERSPD
jgi:hypothetical protein